MARRTRGLSPEDKALWEKVARQTTPLHPKAPDPVPKPPKKQAAQPLITDAPVPTIPQFRLGEASLKKANGHALSPSIADRLLTYSIDVRQ